MIDRIRAYCSIRRREFYWGAILFFTASLGFGMGFEAYKQLFHAPIIIEQCAAQDLPAAAADL